MTAENFDMEELLQYVEERKFRLLRSRLAEMNEADIAEFMEELDDNKKVLIFRMLQGSGGGCFCISGAGYSAAYYQQYYRCGGQ